MVVEADVSEKQDGLISSLFQRRILFLLCPTLFVTALLYVSSPAFAACETDGVQCAPANIDQDGVTVSRQYDLDFLTEKQSMRGEGNAPTGEDKNEFMRVALLKRSNTNFSSHLPIDSVVELCLFNKFDEMLSGIDLHGLPFSKVLDKLKDWFGNRCYKFGADFDTNVAGNFGLELFASYAGGSVDLRYPVSIDISYPDQNQVNPGDKIRIDTAIATRGTPNVVSHAPSAELGIYVSGALDTDGSGKACNFTSCKSKDLWDLDVSGRRHIVLLDGEPGATLDLSDPVLSTLVINSEDLAGFTGKFSIPEIDIANEKVNDQFVLTGSDADRFAQLDILVDQWLLLGLGKVQKLAKKFFGVNKKKAMKKVELLFNLLGITTNVDVIKHQEFTLDPDFSIKLDLSSVVEWDVLDGQRVVDSGQSAQVTLKPGQSLRVKTNEAVMPLDISAEATLPNRFTNVERYELVTATDMALLDVGLETPGITVFGRRCVDFWVGSICTHRWRWDGFDLSYGPLVDETVWEGNHYLNYEFRDDWELKGFQHFPLQQFQVKANSAPEVSSPIADQNLQWDDSIDINLDDHFHDPDGQALHYGVSGRPGFLMLSNGRLYGTVDEDFSGEIRVKASDGYGGEVEDSFHLSVFMPLVDSKRLDMGESKPPESLGYTLSAQPSATAPVTLRVTPDNNQIDMGAGPGASVDLAFNATNWNVPQQIAVTAVDDAVAEHRTTSVVTTMMLSSDANFQGGTGEKTDVYVSDNDRAGISASDNSLLTGEQAGADDTMTVKLTSEPVHDVTLHVSPSDASEFSNVPASLNFDASNWQAAQTITVSGVDDAVEDGTQYGQIQIAATSSDPFYEGKTRNVKARNTDDDQAGVTITPINDLRTTEASEGQPYDDSFRVVLNSQPALGGSVSVSLQVQTGFADEVTLSTPTVVFNASNWNVPQTVTLNGNDDADSDGDQSFSIQTGITSSGAPAYASLNDADIDDLSVTNIDDEQSGLLLTAAPTLQIREDGTTATFSLRLRSRPQADVKVAVTSSNGDEGVVDKGQLLFTLDNWGDEQQVTVTGVDEDVVDGDQNFSVNLTAASDDLLYAGKTAVVQVQNQDDEVAALLVSPDNGLEVNEMGASDSFTVALNKKPASLVTVPVHFNSPVSTEATVSSGSAGPSPMSINLVFTPENWNQAQTVTVTGVNDLTADGDTLFWVIVGEAVSSTPYNGLKHIVTVTNYDADGAEILLSAQWGADVSENGGKAVFSVQLNSMPLVNVNLSFNLSDGLQGSVSPDVLQFTPDNWNVPRFITFTAQDNAVIDGARSVGLNAYVPGGSGIGSAYQGLTSGTLNISISEDDVAGIVVTPQIALRTSESGGSASFDVVLLAQPDANVTVPVESTDTGEGQPDITSLTFTSVNWFVPQKVTVVGQDDVMADDDQAYEIRLLPAVSTDSNYDGVDADDLQAINMDDDVPGVTLSATQLTTTEDGGSASFTVVLDTPPENDVQLSLNVSDPEEVQLSTQILTFTPANWNQPQQVVVTGKNDDETDGDQEITLRLSQHTSGGISSYGSFHIPPVEITNMDNDPVVVLIEEPDTGLRTNESGTEDRFSVVLNAEPSGNVYMEIQVDDPGEALFVDDETDATMATIVLTFTPGNWNLPQEVMVKGVDDSLYDDDQVFNVVTKPTVSVDTRFNGIDPADPAGINEDNDYHPTGYIYHSLTGALVYGGKMSVDCINGTANIVSGHDGSEGFYEFSVSDIDQQATCTLTYTPPPGYGVDDACPAAAGTLDVPVADDPTSPGSGIDSSTGKLQDAGCSSNTWYQSLNITVDSSLLINNNLPMKRGACTYVPDVLQISGDFAGDGTTILSSARMIQTLDGKTEVEVLKPHQLVLKTPITSIKAGAVFRVEAGAGLSVSSAVDLCQ